MGVTRGDGGLQKREGKEWGGGREKRVGSDLLVADLHNKNQRRVATSQHKVGLEKGRAHTMAHRTVATRQIIPFLSGGI